MTRHGWKMLVVGLAMLAGCGYDRELLGDPAPEPEPQVAETQAFDDYSEGTVAPEDNLEMFSDLRFYGSWYTLQPYGWVWRPVVVADWAPMTRGHWVWTSYGWMWVSYDTFEVTYNYGFWTYDFALGWVWVPDTIWAPVRCDWVLHDDYISWCPMPPPQVRYKDPWDGDDLNPWVTVPTRKFKDTEVTKYRVPAKFKSETSHRYTRRSPPEPSAVERSMGRSLVVTDVQLDQPPTGSQLVTRVVMPPEEQAIIDQYRSAAKAKSSGTSSGGSSKPAKDDGNDNNNDSTKERPATKKEEPSKFKERAAEKKTESKKDGGKSKDK